MTDNANNGICSYFREKLTWSNIRYYCCQSRKDAHLFWLSYICLWIILMIIFFIAFLLRPSSTIEYLRWYNDSCSVDTPTRSNVIECDRSLNLFCSSTSNRCSCLNNMFWNGSFCSCQQGMFLNENFCQERLVFSKVCNPKTDICMEYLTCSNSTNTCDCPSNSYYNQTTCNSKIPFNSTETCTLSSQCVNGLVCSSNVCTCPTSQSWNGNGCSNSSTHGQYCLTTLQCDASAHLICNSTYFRCTCNENFYWDGKICRVRLTNGSLCVNTQQCQSSLICRNQYCQCPLINTQYWSSQTSTCETCFGKDLFLFGGICYYFSVPMNSTRGTYSTLSSIYSLSTIQYDYQFDYVFNQHIRIFNWTPIFFSVENPIQNHFHWSPDRSIIRPKYMCNQTLTSNFISSTLAFQLESNSQCFRAWPTTTITGQLAYQLNNYVYHTR